MIAPAAMFIEAAQDQLADPEYTKEHPILESQDKEVRFAIPPTDKHIPEDASEAFYTGYMLGVQTARILLAGMPAAVLHKVEI